MVKDNENELTEKEREELSQLKVGFNIVKEHEDMSVLAANRVELSRKWSRKLLQISFVLNILTLALFLLSAAFVVLKPSPSFYASTPSGKVIGPLPKIELQ